MSLGREGRVRAVPVNVIWAHLQVVADWWVVRYLLHEDFRTVLHASLVSLAQDWIQRLVKEVRFVDVAERDSDHELHSLHWVSR